jgi:hypothetical protein
MEGKLKFSQALNWQYLGGIFFAVFQQWVPGLDHTKVHPRQKVYRKFVVAIVRQGASVSTFSSLLQYLFTIIRVCRG